MNHCKHRLVVRGAPEDVERVFEAMRGLPGTANELMDLNSLLPMPESLTRLQEFDRLGRLQQAARNEAAFAEYRREKSAARSAAWLETGFENWGEWARAAWGTVSNVFDVEYSSDEYGALYFSTAWTPAIPALGELSIAFPEVTLEISFAEEGGYYLGRGTIRGGKKRVRGYPIRTPEGRQIFEQFWGEWFGPEGDDDKDDDGLIDLTHKAAS